ncbi:M3 family oligoendopeptidase [Candidatus Nomurabacteria bacterium]|nr:MAG: M3 family oligoendopeptidase [Candidatus Nomurabacteria bacterium]
MKTKWNLKLLYKSLEDPQINKDVSKLEESYQNFKKKYQAQNYLHDEKKLLEALELYESFDLIQNPLYYLFYFTDIQNGNAKAEALRSSITQRLTNASNQIVFFTLSLAKISKAEQQKILTNNKFKKFHHFLEQIFITSKYRLTESEEKILNLKSLPGHTLWREGQEKLLGNTNVIFKDKKMSIGEAMNKIPELSLRERHGLNEQVMKMLKSISHFAESEMNALIIDKKINDELRGYAHPASATIIGYENDEKAILNFVETVSNYFPISHRFLKIKQKMLGLRTLTYADRSAPVGKTKRKISFENAIEIIKVAFEKVNPEYRKIFENYLRNGQIDVFPYPGKRSGAYCSSDEVRPTFVLLNYTESMKSVMTMAHEMGHAIHAEYSKTQPIISRNHTIATAEVASTLFENFAFEEIFATLSEEEKIIALHDRIGDDVQTIFRQIACFNFETELHLTVREKGTLAKEEIAKLMNKHMGSYLGPNFKFTELDGYFFVYWSHIRQFFYVYSYAYGQLISKSLYAKYKADPSYLLKIEEFLKAGGSKSPEQIFKDIGIDTSKSGFFIEGLKSIEADIKRLEKLVGNGKKKK